MNYIKNLKINLIILEKKSQLTPYAFIFLNIFNIYSINNEFIEDNEISNNTNVKLELDGNTIFLELEPP